jgi:hypothetical protein
MASYNSVEWKEHVSDYDRVFHRPPAARIESTDEGEPDDGPPVRPPLLSLQEWLSKPKARRKRPYAQNPAFELQQLNQGESRGPKRRDADPTATTASAAATAAAAAATIRSGAAEPAAAERERWVGASRMLAFSRDTLPILYSFLSCRGLCVVQGVCRLWYRACCTPKFLPRVLLALNPQNRQEVNMTQSETTVAQWMSGFGPSASIEAAGSEWARFYSRVGRFAVPNSWKGPMDTGAVALPLFCSSPPVVRLWLEDRPRQPVQGWAAATADSPVGQAASCGVPTPRPISTTASGASAGAVRAKRMGWLLFLHAAKNCAELWWLPDVDRLNDVRRVSEMAALWRTTLVQPELRPERMFALLKSWRLLALPINRRDVRRGTAPPRIAVYQFGPSGCTEVAAVSLPQVGMEIACMQLRCPLRTPFLLSGRPPKDEVLLAVACTTGELLVWRINHQPEHSRHADRPLELRWHLFGPPLSPSPSPAAAPEPHDAQPAAAAAAAAAAGDAASNATGSEGSEGSGPPVFRVTTAAAPPGREGATVERAGSGGSGAAACVTTAAMQPCRANATVEWAGSGGSGAAACVTTAAAPPGLERARVEGAGSQGSGAASCVRTAAAPPGRAGATVEGAGSEGAAGAAAAEGAWRRTRVLAEDYWFHLGFGETDPDPDGGALAVRLRRVRFEERAASLQSSSFLNGPKKSEKRDHRSTWSVVDLEAGTVWELAMPRDTDRVDIFEIAVVSVPTSHREPLVGSTPGRFFANLLLTSDPLAQLQPPPPMAAAGRRNRSREDLLLVRPETNTTWLQACWTRNVRHPRADFTSSFEVGAGCRFPDQWMTVDPLTGIWTVPNDFHTRMFHLPTMSVVAWPRVATWPSACGLRASPLQGPALMIDRLFVYAFSGGGLSVQPFAAGHRKLPFFPLPTLDSPLHFTTRLPSSSQKLAERIVTHAVADRIVLVVLNTGAVALVDPFANHSQFPTSALCNKADKDQRPVGGLVGVGLPIPSPALLASPYNKATKNGRFSECDDGWLGSSTSLILDWVDAVAGRRRSWRRGDRVWCERWSFAGVVHADEDGWGNVTIRGAPLFAGIAPSARAVQHIREVARRYDAETQTLVTLIRKDRAISGFDAPPKPPKPKSSDYVPKGELVNRVRARSVDRLKFLFQYYFGACPDDPKHLAIIRVAATDPLLLKAEPDHDNPFGIGSSAVFSLPDLQLGGPDFSEDIEDIITSEHETSLHESVRVLGAFGKYIMIRSARFGRTFCIRHDDPALAKSNRRIKTHPSITK